MSVSINAKGELLTVMLEGEIDHHTAKTIREQIDEAIEFNMPSLLILDFGRVSFMDSSGIGLVMGRYRILQKNNAKMNLVNLPSNIYKVMKLAGIERLAKIEKELTNESFARSIVSAFASQLDPTIEEISDIKTAVSEAVTNCIVHAYANTKGDIYITGEFFDNGLIRIKIRDKGCGIEDIKRAMEPLYSSQGGERAGLGFSVMESFMDGLRVTSKVGKGTTVTMRKMLGVKSNEQTGQDN